MPITDETNEPVMTELDDASIEAVAGGLNPQPLPPRHAVYRLD
jgi:hypothetical protein